MTTKTINVGNVNHKCSKHVDSILSDRGVDYMSFIEPAKTFNVVENLVTIESAVDKVLIKNVTPRRQYSALNSIYNNPLRGKYTLAINSFPSDLRARQLALMLMIRMVNQMITKKIRGNYPIWHRIYGNYKDTVRDAGNRVDASCIILLNVNNESTQLKVEKLRDLLEMYSNVPRIVVFGGTNPIEFFANRLHYPLSAAINIGPDNRIREEV